jgi:hypothetical protein
MTGTPLRLHRSLTAGFRIPGVARGTTGADLAETSVAIGRLRQAVQRLASGEPARFHNPAFGELTEEDRIRLHLRHAELHLGFLAID